MKTYCLTLLLLILFLASVSSVAFASTQEFTIINASNSDLYGLSVTPANSTTQGPNALKGRELLSGQSVRVAFPNYDATIAQWDILGITCCGDKLKWQQLNLNTAHTITIQENGMAELN